VRILVVEDEHKLAQALASALQAEHYDVILASTGEEGFFRANAESFAAYNAGRVFAIR
jgi:DNA-binding response OmpR family regulator